MANQNALTAAHIRYLLVLLRLTAANGHTRCVDLAAALELSPPSVHNMVDTMTALGLVKKGTRGAVADRIRQQNSRAVPAVLPQRGGTAAAGLPGADRAADDDLSAAGAGAGRKPSGAV